MLRFARRLAVALCAVLLSSCTETPTIPDTANEPSLQFHYGSDHDDELPSELSAIARFDWWSVPRGPSANAAFIGPAGGSLRLYDYEIVIPPGAVDRVRRFEIRIPPYQSQRRYAAVWLSPHGYEFARPVKIRMPYAGTESEGAPNINVLWWDDGAWVELPTVRTHDGRIETTTTHFSLYATERRGFTLAGG